MRRKLIVASGVLLAAAVVVPVMARVSVTIGAETQSVQLLHGCIDGSQLWQVTTRVTVKNASADDAVFNSNSFWTKFTTRGNPGQIQDQVTVVNADGFAPGTIVRSGESDTFEPTLQVEIPCDTSGASMFAGVHLNGSDKLYLAGDPFLNSGTPVPSGPVGVFGIALIAAITGLLALRLGRKGRAMPMPVN